MAEIPLSRGLFALVDDDLFDWLNQWTWFAKGGGGGKTVYACRVVQFAGVRTNFWMHRIIACAPPNASVDHRNRNGLDNRRANLRWANQRQNAANVVKGVRSATGFRGVSYEYGRYCAKISVDGTSRRLGMTDSAEQAARLYDMAAARLFGEFAILNFPEDGGRVDPGHCVRRPQGGQRPAPDAYFALIRGHGYSEAAE